MRKTLQRMQRMKKAVPKPKPRLQSTLKAMKKVAGPAKPIGRVKSGAAKPSPLASRLTAMKKIAKPSLLGGRLAAMKKVAKPKPRVRRKPITRKATTRRRRVY